MSTPAASAHSRRTKPHPPATFLTNHAHVLLCLAADSEARMREVAVRVGLTERAVQRIVAALEAEGYLTAERVGRANRYAVNDRRPLGHPLEAHRTVRDLLAMAPDSAGE